MRQACLLVVCCHSLVSGQLEFTEPDQVKAIDTEITIGLTIVNIKRVKSITELFQEHVDDFILSLLLHSSGEPIKMVVITDHYSLPDVNFLLVNSRSKVLTKGVVLKMSDRNFTIPTVAFVFVDIEKLVEGEEKFIQELKNNAEEGLELVNNEKYYHNLFYLGPIYHRKFLQLDRIIFVDVDLVFHANIKDLERKFSGLGEKSGRRCLAVAPDLSPHYRRRLKIHRANHPESKAGDPGSLSQGLNTGVMLYHLKCLRESEDFKSQLEEGSATQLVYKYQMKLTLGDQDWFSMLAWQHPNLFLPLSCKWNYQNSVQYLLDPEMAALFQKYHYCGLFHTAYIEHRNGCGPLPEHCAANVKVEVKPVGGW